MDLPAKSASRSHSTSQALNDQTLVLPDGRHLGFAEYGSPTGYPLIFLHGFPSSRLEASGIEQLTRRRDLRIISPDRPGFGLSTPQLNRRIMDWPADVEALTHHLGISRFALLGGSGGGPYALACAHTLPHEMLSAVGIIAGAPPWQAGTQDLPMIARVTDLFAKYWPTGMRLVTDGLIGMLKWFVATGTGSRYIDKWLLSIESKGETTKPIEERKRQLLRLAFEAFAQGGEGFVHETQLLTDNWGFRFEDVNYDRIQVWHGKKDTNSPIRMIRYMTERLPHAVLQEFDDTHFTMHQHMDEILSELIPEQAKCKVA
jgi:pimeloyl-ACP methyl ester carboxylesterase